ncbi:cytidine deaminase [Flavitalea flava]
MQKKEYAFVYEEYPSEDELSEQDAQLLNQAKAITNNAYAPYSRFKVGVVARLTNGHTLSGTNQENASYPAGICAERVLLSTASSLYPGVAIESMAVSYKNENGPSDRPISPCGICRQSLQEFEQRTGKPVRLILGGLEGKVYIISKSVFLLPLAFTSEELI